MEYKIIPGMPDINLLKEFARITGEPVGSKTYPDGKRTISISIGKDGSLVRKLNFESKLDVAKTSIDEEIKEKKE